MRCISPTVTETTSNNQETYIGLTENEFKTRFNLQKSSFKLEHKITSTTLTEHVWKKKKKQEHQLQYQMGDCQKSKAIRTKKMIKCANFVYKKNLSILRSALFLNKRSEIF